MDTFLIGFLSAVVILFLIAMVVGLVWIVRLTKKVNSLDNVVQNEVNQVYVHMDKEINSIYHRCSDLESNFEKQLDSRINKLENKIVK